MESVSVMLTDRDGKPRRGALTTDHPASSYGMPVLVILGEVYGPSDIYYQGIRRMVPADGWSDDAVAAATQYLSQLPLIRWCRRCGHLWLVRKPVRPGTCPDCRAAAWDRPRKEGDPGPAPRARR